ncbi:unnamed protein product [Adineta steineri]|uniref:Uncharacterized protein n=1 Tax=Adineta steineri TaxID=433720 RepID=A0A819AXA5_9BILA|nr:unnamed protein product [Adineta steineri]
MFDVYKGLLSNDDRSKPKVLFAFGALLGLFLISTIVLATLYGLEKNKASTTTTTTTTVNDEACLTPYCIKAANYLLESIDETVDPCEDFFEFTCGTWLKNHKIPDDAGSQDTFNALRTQLDSDVVDILTLPLPNEMTNIQSIKNARILYDSCNNETNIESDGVNAILSLVNNEFGGWPILQGSSWNAASFNFSNLLLKLREYSSNIIYSCGTSTDDRNSSVYYIRVSQSDLALEQRSNYVGESKLITAYQQFIRDFASLLTNDTTTIAQDVTDIYNFEKSISIHHLTPAEQRARQNETVRTTIGNLSQTFSTSFDFTNYLRRVYSSSGVTLNNDDVVSISELDYLRNASSIINQASARTIQNYFIWRFMMNRVSNMPKRYRATREPFDREFRGTSSEKPRSLTCGNYVNANMGFAVSKVYITRYFDENARAQSLEMINNIRDAFIEMVKDSTWMDETSKGRAIEKALAIDEKIGYPEYLSGNNITELEKMYEEYGFTESYAPNVLKLLQIKSKEGLYRLREIVDRKSWGTSSPTVVNAFYTPSKNQISFPAGILQMPFFNKDAPKYLNYGGIGAVIGHEITHGFDDNGRQFDKDGNRVLWWTPETIEKFIERKTCIVDQYSNYTVAQINRTVNGNQTQGENIADNGGVKEAFYAYQKWARENGDLNKKLPGLKNYSTEQLFFMNYGQIWCSKMTDANALNRVQTGVHSPGRFRVIGPTSNFPEFDRVFNCKPGQGNSRVNKCTVWKLQIVLGALLGIFIIIAIVFAALYGVEKSKASTANYLLESIDETVDPCEDFFEFTCGTWLKTHKIPDDDILTLPLPNEMTNIQSIKNARILYDSCNNETNIESDGVTAILSLVNNEFGGWPILQGSSWNAASFNFSNLLLKLREYSSNIIYSCDTETDEKNSSVYYIQVSQSNLALEQRSNYVGESKLITAYQQFIRDFASTLTTDTTTIAQDVTDIYNFEKSISIYHLTPAEQSARHNETVRTTIGNLSETFSTSVFDFTNYLRQVYSASGVTLNDNDIVSISELDYLRNASSIINQASARTIQNYFIWRFMMNRVSNMPKRYRATREPFDREFRGTSSEKPRSLTCGNYVNKNMGFAVSKVYITRYFDENAKAESLEMINNIRDAFIEMVKDSTWMDETSKGRAIEKALAIDEKIGYPDYLSSNNITELQKMYEEYIFTGSYATNVLKVLQLRSKESLRTLRETVDRKSWGTYSPPTVVNAFYMPSKNQIVFPAGILQMPFFNKDAPKYLNYGGIGAVIGHEITHGFDDTGRQFDKDGNRVLWWTPETIEKFIERKTCIVDQYSNYTVAQINRTLNGDQTQGENIADNGGVKEAFYAFQKWARENGDLNKKLPGLKKYSTEQLFFMNYGQIWCSKMTDANALNRVQTGVHSPGRFRVIGPPSNFAEFDRVFNCKPGQGNSRVNKCTVW